MKKFIYIIIIVSIILFLSSCKRQTGERNEAPSKKVDTTAVVYFSVSDDIKSLAQSISNNGGFDLFEIMPSEVYTSSDVTFDENSRAYIEHSDKNLRPEMINELILDKYDTIYLGFPVWFNSLPNIIYSFIDNTDLVNKKIYLFSIGSQNDISECLNELISYSDKLYILDGINFNYNYTEDEIKRWLNTNNSISHESVTILINDKPYLMELENNSSSKELVNSLTEKYQMKDLNNNQKYMYLDNLITENATHLDIIYKGDVLLSHNNKLIIFYENTNSLEDYTKIGHIPSLDNMPKKDITIEIKK